LVDLLKDGSRHFSGVEESVLRNIEACNDLSNIVRTSLGPNGMKKMVINHLEKLFVTSDAATIMKELEVVHPAAKMIVLASKQMALEIGDNTNLVVILCGELLQQAASLIFQGLHTSDIITGYNKALEKSLEFLEGLAVDTVTDVTDIEQIQKSLKSAITSKVYGWESIIAPLVAQACIHILPTNRNDFVVDNIRICKILGGGVSDSCLIKGFALPKDTEGSIKHVKNAVIAVFGGPLEASKSETKGTVLLTNADDLLNYSKGEEQIMEESIKAIADSGANVIVAGGAVSSLALHYCERYNIMVIKESSKFQLRRICKATGACGLLRLGKPSPEELGSCDECSVDEIGSTKVTVFRNSSEKCKVSTILIRGSTSNILDDVERAIDNAVNVFKATIRDGRLVAGAGAVQIELAKLLQPVGEASPGLDQYAINKFAESLQIIPRTLAENAGLDATALVTSLVASHQQGNDKDGIDVDEGCVKSAVDLGVFDLLVGIHWALKLAADTAVTVLQVDQIIMAKTAGGPKMPQMGSRDA